MLISGFLSIAAVRRRAGTSLALRAMNPDVARRALTAR
jgi:hypothetical protein